MGEVAVLFRLMPSSPQVDLKKVAEGVRSSVPKGVTLRAMQTKDIAYGLKALLVSVLMTDVEGLLTSAEEAFARVPGVESVEVMEEGLL